MNVLYSLYHIIPSQTLKHLQFYSPLLLNRKDLMQWRLLNFAAFPSGEILKGEITWRNLYGFQPYVWTKTITL